MERLAGWFRYYTSSDAEPIDSGMLQVANKLANLSATNQDLGLDVEIPRLVVVGSQSSGKSSLINAIVGMDVLPVGRSMATRAPLVLQLLHEPGKHQAHLYRQRDGHQSLVQELSLTDPETVAAAVEALTKEVAGCQKDICPTEITLEVRSEQVPNLSFVDLPGLTMVACTDQGQPTDIKHQIRELVGRYIQGEHAIVLAVMPAREDLETDVALDLIKEYDPHFKRTLGVLTKVDLMGAGGDVSPYLLSQGISKDLSLGLGYFAVQVGGRCARTLSEKRDAEASFFESHQSAYQNCKPRLGVHNLVLAASLILKRRLQATLPGLLDRVRALAESTRTAVTDMGGALPTTPEGQVTFLRSLLANLSREYVNALENRFAIIRYGKCVKDELVLFRRQVDEQDWLQAMPDTHIQQVIDHASGNHMSFTVPAVDVLETIIKDTRQVDLLQHAAPTAFACVHAVQQLLKQLLQELLRSQATGRFPALVHAVEAHVLDKLLQPLAEQARDKIQECIQIERGYVWTDDDTFRKQLHALASCDAMEIDHMRQAVQAYVVAVKKHLNHHIPKLIMFHLVHRLEELLHMHLSDFPRAAADAASLLSEGGELADTRNRLQQHLSLLQEAEQLLVVAMDEAAMR